MGIYRNDESMGMRRRSKGLKEEETGAISMSLEANRLARSSS
jgi:hypothetical protein